jgi:hypothetical protein
MTKTITAVTIDSQILTTAGEGKTHAVVKWTPAKILRAQYQRQADAVKALELRLQAPHYQDGTWVFDTLFAEARATAAIGERGLAKIAHLDDDAKLWAVLSWHKTHDAALAKAKSLGGSRCGVEVLEAYKLG